MKYNDSHLSRISLDELLCRVTIGVVLLLSLIVFNRLFLKLAFFQEWFSVFFLKEKTKTSPDAYYLSLFEIGV